MAGPIRQQIDLSSLDRFVRANVPDIRCPLDVKQVSFVTCHSVKVTSNSRGLLSSGTDNRIPPTTFAMPGARNSCFARNLLAHSSRPPPTRSIANTESSTPWQGQTSPCLEPCACARTKACSARPSTSCRSWTAAFLKTPLCPACRPRKGGRCGGPSPPRWASSTAWCPKRWGWRRSVGMATFTVGSSRRFRSSASIKPRR